MNILVTGHRGFIGTNLFPKLQSRFSDNIIGLDIKDGNDLISCELPQADVIIHLAGLSGVRQSLDNPTEYWKQNVIVSQRLFDHFEGKRIMYASSSTAKEPWRNPYALSKHAIEQIAPSNTLGMRFTTVYGPNARKQMLIPSIIRHDVSYINTDHSRDFIHVNDVCSAIIMMIDNQECGIIDVGTGISNKLVDIMEYCKITYQGRIGKENERKDNKAEISNLTKYGWKPEINLYKYLDKEMEMRVN